MKPITNVLVLGLLLFASTVFGQLTTTFSPASLPSVPVGNNVTLQLKVTGFTNINSLQLPITYNSNILRFDSIDYPALPGYIDTTLNSHPNLGKIVVTWFPNQSQYPTGVTLPNGTAILTLRFTVIGSGTNIVNVSTVAPGIEVINSAGNNVTVTYANGGSTVIGSGGGGGGSSCTGSGNPPAATTYTGFRVIANNIYIPQGQYGCVPITVNDFDLIVALTFAVHWDPAVLQYDCTRMHNPLLVDLANKITNPAPNTLVVGWDDPAAAGVNLADGAKMVDICFRGIGAPGAKTRIYFDANGLSQGGGSICEAYNASSMNVFNNTAGPNYSGVQDTVYMMDPANIGCGPVFTADMDTLPNTNMQTCIDVKVTNFFWMTGSEFSMTYDPTKLTYQNIQLGSNPLTLATSGANSNFTTSNGLIKFNWRNTTAANGVSLPNNTTIFSVCFNATLPQGSETPISFSSSSCSPQGVTRKNIGGVPFVLNNGKVLIPAATISAVATATSPQCNGGPGSLSVTPSGGTATAYAWAGPNNYSSNVQNPTNPTASGTYTVTVTFAGSGTATATATMSVPPAISIPAQTTTVQGVACFGGNNGSVTINPVGGTAPFTYKWNGPNGFMATTKDISSLNSGNYVVTVTDSKTCTLVSSPYNVSAPSPISVPSTPNPVTNIKCAGGKDGAISIVPSGGTQGYSIAWSGPGSYTGTGANITGLSAGDYVYTVTDARNCTYIAPAPLKVTEPAAISPTLGTVTDVKCFNTASGAIALSVSGGTPGSNPAYTFVWKNTANNITVSNDQNPANLAAGTYSVTVTDGNQCTKTLANPVTISGPASALAVNGSTTPASCSGVPDGTMSLSVSGGWPGATTVSWTGGPVPVPPINPVTGVPAGTYTYTVTDPKGCAVTGQLTVGGAPDITIGTPIVTNLLCAGTGNGCITIQPSGGSNAPYTVDWTNTSLKGSTICGLSGGSYTPTVKDAAGCTKVFSAIVVTEPQPIVLTPVSITKQNGVAANGAIDLNVAGGTLANGAVYKYVWTGPNGFTATTQDITGLVNGTYTVIVRDDNNCAMTGTYVVEQENLMLLTTVDSIKNSCSNDGCIYLNIPNGTQSPFTISWNGGTQSGINDYTPAICGLGAGLYNLTVTAANGLSVVISNKTIAQLAQVFVSSTATPPNGSSKNGSITISPSNGYGFVWNTGAKTNIISSLDSGTYVVTITNLSSGCTTTQVFQLSRIYPPLVTSICSQTNLTCASALNGKLSACAEGGALPYSYKWVGPNGFMATTKEITGLAPGIYTVTITDAIAQTQVQTTTLTSQSNLAIMNVNETSLCNGYQVCGASSCDGAANVVFSGQFGNPSILWSNGVTNVNNTTLCGGPYAVTITDALGCTSVWADELTAPAPLTVNALVLNQPSCNGECDAIVRVKAIGGVGPYVVKWSTNQIDQLANTNAFSQGVNLCGATYTVTITDASNITTTYAVVVPEPAPIELEYTVNPPHSFNSCDGEIVVKPNGAVLPVSVTWSGNFGHTGTGNRATNLCAGESISFVITDANGCIATGNDTIPYPEDGCLRVRPVLTPGQQDGNNDYLFITCIEKVKNTVEIYNRWGQLVFETTNYNNNSNNWKGTTKSNQPLAEGAYFYILTFTNDDGIQEQRKGYINLLR
ncbi:MAG: gliding motility-associated C-terminal domain-containing protein [Bacteroidetes bacterium]|nr:gliding motility-associated C-terminal domain-containing protein [Bacteroidota bacterium]